MMAAVRWWSVLMRVEEEGCALFWMGDCYTFSLIDGLVRECRKKVLSVQVWLIWNQHYMQPQDPHGSSSGQRIYQSQQLRATPPMLQQKGTTTIMVSQ